MSALSVPMEGELNFSSISSMTPQNPEGPLTNCQPTEYSCISVNPIPHHCVP